MSKHIPMEEKIKNFDRSIEKLMNESSAEPPFGMWNRISAELEVTEALPLAAAAPVALVAKRAAYGFMVAAALIGTSLLTALVVSNSSHSENTVAEKPIAALVTTPIETKTEPAVITQEVVVKKHTVQISKPVSIAKPVEDVVVPSQSSLAENKMDNTGEVAVPSTYGNQNAPTVVDAYYFPPVDMNIAEKKSGVVETTKPLEEEKVVDKKAKAVSSSSNDKRISIKKHKRGGFTYGSLNRLRKQRSKY